MQKRATFFPIFLIFLILSVIIFFLAQRGVLGGLTGFLEQMTSPLQKLTFNIFHVSGGQSTEDKLREENKNLLIQLAKQKELEKENKALHDQFETAKLETTKLLPAEIVGMNEDSLIIDKGSSDGVKKGEVVVYKDNLLGKVVAVEKHLSVVNLLTNKDISFTAQTSKTSATGVVNGGSSGIILGTVVLSDKLEKDDIVVTKGNVDSKGNGFPPGLAVGKIISVEKHPSALFQAAEVKSLVSFSKLKVVFVLLEF